MHAVVGSRYIVQFALGESATFFPLTKPLSKRDFYFFYSTMAVKETVIFIYSMSFWHKVEVNTENMFEFKTLMNKTVPYYLYPFIVQRRSGLHLFRWTPIADTISPDYSDVLRELDFLWKHIHNSHWSWSKFCIAEWRKRRYE